MPFVKIGLTPETKLIDLIATILFISILIVYVVFEIITIKKVSLKNLETTTNALSFIVFYTLCFLLKAILQFLKFYFFGENNPTDINMISTYLQIIVFLVDVMIIFLVIKFVLEI